MRDPRALIDTATLAASLGDSSLRVFDCTTTLDPAPAGSTEPYIAVPGRKTFEDSHVPGADFLDLQGEFSDTATYLHFMMPSVARLEAAFGRHGVGPGTRVVLYSIGTMMWATRFWWMLRSLGFDDAAVLGGGLDKWKAEGRPLETGAPRGYPPATFVAAPRDGLFVDAARVKAAIGRRDNRDRERAGAAVPSRAGAQPLRPDRAAYPAASTCRRPRWSIPRPRASSRSPTRRRSSPPRGWSKDKRTICYCGGGISATIDLFLLHQLGHDDITLYDASMGEWAKTESLPIETD